MEKDKKDPFTCRRRGPNPLHVCATTNAKKCAGRLEWAMGLVLWHNNNAGIISLPAWLVCERITGIVRIAVAVRMLLIIVMCPAADNSTLLDMHVHACQTMHAKVHIISHRAEAFSYGFFDPWWCTYAPWEWWKSFVAEISSCFFGSQTDEFVHC